MNNWFSVKILSTSFVHACAYFGVSLGRIRIFFDKLSENIPQYKESCTTWSHFELILRRRKKLCLISKYKHPHCFSKRAVSHSLLPCKILIETKLWKFCSKWKEYRYIFWRSLFKSQDSVNIIFDSFPITSKSPSRFKNLRKHRTIKKKKTFSENPNWIRNCLHANGSYE